jgi:hypothetical protein
MPLEKHEVQETRNEYKILKEKRFGMKKEMEGRH